jgi:hypothetical protein
MGSNNSTQRPQAKPRSYSCVRKRDFQPASEPEILLSAAEEACIVSNPSDFIFESIGVPNGTQLQLKIRDPDWKWPNGEIAYEIDRSLNDFPKLKTEIEEAIKRYAEVTPIRFRKLEIQDPITDWILFKYHPDVTDSDVGRIGGRQHINISHWAEKGHVMHEIMHALGFQHEHTRADRDHYVMIEEKKIPEDLVSNYERQGHPLGDYDPESIMHYGIDGIMRADRNLASRMGQRVDFSEGDLKAIRYVYSEPRCTYDFFKDEYFVQTCYECLTCWGPDSVYGVCVFCSVKCHQGHDLKIHHYSEMAEHNIKFVCDCGRNKHKLDICTRVSTKERSVQQMFYVCHQCFDVQEGENKVGLCHPCLKKCHNGHAYEEIGVLEVRCECGRKDWRNQCCAVLED